MAHKLNISADFTSVKKSIVEISSNLKNLSKQQSISIFDKDSIAFLKGAASDALEGMKKDMDALTSKARALREEYKQEGQSLDLIAKKKHEILNVEKERIKLQTNMNKLEKDSASLGGGSEKGSFGGSLLKSLGKIPGLGGVAGLMGGGLGLGAIAGLGVGAAAVGGGMYGYGRAKTGYNQYMEGIDSRIMLRGRGVNDVNGLHAGLGRMGYGPEDIRQAQLQSSEGFGAANSGTDAIYGRARFAKNVGLDLSQVQGAGASMRGSMGTDQAAKAFATLQGNVISKGIKDAVGPYLETAANMLTELNENGMGFDKGALDALGTLVSKTGISAERAASVIQGTNSNIMGATGERSAFYQTAAGAAGLGNGTLGGAKEAANLGMFGLDGDKAKKMLTPDQLAHYKQMGLVGNSGYMKKFVGGIEKSMPQFENTAEGDLGKGRFLESQGIGHGSAASALSTFNLMKTAAGGGRGAGGAMKELREGFGSPEERMKAILGETKQINEVIGMKVAPIMAEAKDTLNSIDRSVLGIAQKMGVSLPDEKNRERDTKLERAGIAPGSLDTMSDSELNKNMQRVSAQQSTMNGKAGQVEDMFGKTLGGFINRFMGTGDFSSQMEEVKGILKSQLDAHHATNRELGKARGGLPSQRQRTR